MRYDLTIEQPHSHFKFNPIPLTSMDAEENRNNRANVHVIAIPSNKHVRSHLTFDEYSCHSLTFVVHSMERDRHTDESNSKK